MLDHPPLLASQFFHLSDAKRMRYAVFTPKTPRATILIAPGRREFIEKKYAEMGEELLRRNFRLIFFEWRGQGLSDRWLTGPSRQRDHAVDFQTHLDDLEAFYAAVAAPYCQGPLFVHGHSMGGHLILRWLVERQPKTASAVFLTAPMLALSSLPVHTTARALSWSFTHLGYEGDYAAAQADYGKRDRDFVNNPLTHDSERFAIMEKYFTAYPDMTVGGVTWGWLDAALKSMHRIQHRRYFENFALPLLTIIGGADRVTPTLEVARVLKRIQHGETLILNAGYHDILNETDGYRIQAWGEFDRFATRVIGA